MSEDDRFRDVALQVLDSPSLFPSFSCAAMFGEQEKKKHLLAFE